MVTVCAWCQKYMGSKEPLHNPAVSHGICDDCFERDFLDDAPAESRARASKLTGALRDGIAAAAKRLAADDRRGRDRFALALVGIPYGAVRTFLPQAVPPAELDPVILAAVRAALAAR